MTTYYASKLNLDGDARLAGTRLIESEVKAILAAYERVDETRLALPDGKWVIIKPELYLSELEQSRLAHALQVYQMSNEYHDVRVFSNSVYILHRTHFWVVSARKEKLFDDQIDSLRRTAAALRKCGFATPDPALLPLTDTELTDVAIVAGDRERIKELIHYLQGDIHSSFERFRLRCWLDDNKRTRPSTRTKPTRSEELNALH